MAATGGGPSPILALLKDVNTTFYGYVKADASYDTNDVNVGNFARWVEMEDPDKKDDGQFNITARQTRLGTKFEGPEENGVKTSARVEVDFYGGGDENKAMPMLRHAYVNVDWQDSDFSLLMGQTSDVISPLVMPTVNYTVAWWSGDIGYRHNQIRATKGIAVGEDSKILIQVAGTRVIGAEDIGRPGAQARVAYTFPAGAGKATVGLSTLKATEAGHTDATATALDFSVPVASGTTVKGEYFTGENTDAYLGNIGQASTTSGAEIESMGYWIAVQHSLNEKTSLAVGYGAEENEDSDIAAGTRQTNSTAFANVNHKLTSNTTAGFEIAQHSTEYKDDDTYDDLRVQLALTFKF